MTRKNVTASIVTMFLGVVTTSFTLVALSAVAETLMAYVLIGAGAFVLLFLFFNLADVVLDA